MRQWTFWEIAINSLLCAVGGLALYVVGVTVTLQTVGAAICATSLTVIVIAYVAEIVRTLRRK